MSFNVFISFPFELNDGFEADKKESFDEIIKGLTKIKSILRDKEYRFFYDSSNVQKFLDLCDFVEVEGYLRSIDTQLRRLLKNSSSNLLEISKSFGDLVHYRFNHSQLIHEYENLILRNACEQIDKDSNVALINFNDHLDEVNECISMLRDSPKDSSLPEMRKIPSLLNFSEFEYWLKSTDSGVFSLKDNLNFIPTPFRWNKQRIYQHKESKYHWYYDYYHKDNKEHYEVFSEDGKTHIGEADANGKLDKSKNNVSKKIDSIIN